MTNAQMTELKDHIDFKFDEILQFCDERIAILVNAINPGQLEPCLYCGKLVTKPYRNNADHGADFCSHFCMVEYIDQCNDDLEEAAEKIADEKIPKKHQKLWDKIQDGVLSGPASVHRGVKIKDVGIQIVPNEEDGWSCEGDDGEGVKYYFSVSDGTHVCYCECNICKKEFEIAAHTLISSKGLACPHCKKKE